MMAAGGLGGEQPGEAAAGRSVGRRAGQPGLGAAGRALRSSSSSDGSGAARPGTVTKMAAGRKRRGCARRWRARRGGAGKRVERGREGASGRARAGGRVRLPKPSLRRAPNGRPRSARCCNGGGGAGEGAAMMAARRPPALAGRGPLWESGAGLRRALPRRAGAALSGAGSLAVTDDALQEKNPTLSTALSVRPGTRALERELPQREFKPGQLSW